MPMLTKGFGSFRLVKSASRANGYYANILLHHQLSMLLYNIKNQVLFTVSEASQSTHKNVG